MMWPAVPAGMQLHAVPAGMQLPAVPAGLQLPAGVQVPAGVRHVHTVLGQGLLAASLAREPQRAGRSEYPARFYPL